MAERLTRSELYHLVWGEPMTTVAKRFGISDVALKKHCAKARIPVPPRGHWAKLQAGKRTFMPGLPERPPGMDDELEIGRAHRYYQPRWTDQELLGPLPEPPSFDEPIESVRDREAKALARRPRAVDREDVEQQHVADLAFDRQEVQALGLHF